MPVDLISRGDVFRALFCGVFAVAAFTATESRAAAPTPRAMTLKTVAVNAADVVFTYEYTAAPAATFTILLPGISDPNKISIEGFGWSFSSPEIVPNGDGTLSAQITNSGGAKTGKLKATVTADPGAIKCKMKTAYINLGTLDANPPSLPRYVKVTNRTGTTIPQGTVLHFRKKRNNLLISKLAADLQPVPNVNGDGHAGVAYCIVGVENRVAVENVEKKPLDAKKPFDAAWLPVAVGGGTVEFRMAEAWSFTLKKIGGGTVDYEFIDLRENFAPFPANGRRLDRNGITFDSAPRTTKNVLWSVSTIPVTVSANATAQNWSDFLLAFTDNAETLCKAKNTKQKNDNCGVDPYCFYRQWLDGRHVIPLLKPKSPPFKNAVQNGNDVVAFLKDAKSWVDKYRKIKNESDQIKARLALLGQRQREIQRSGECADCVSTAMISEPANSLKTASFLADQKMRRFGDSLLNHLHGWNRLVDNPEPRK